MKKWQIIQKIDVSPSKWFPVEKHIVQLEDGRIVDDYFIAPFGEIAMILPITTTGEIVFVKQHRHGIYDILLELPAGFCQTDKTIEETAVAELHEETGIKINTSDLEPLGKLSNMPSKLKSITHGFLAQNLQFNAQQQLDETESIEIITIKPKRVLELIDNQKIWAVDTVAFILKAYRKYPHLFT